MENSKTSFFKPSLSMKIFGSADTINLEPSTGTKSRKQFIYGAWVGMANFYRAILEHGTFDEYHFFADTKLHADLLRKNISRLNLKRNKIKIIGLNELPAYLENTKYTVFFSCGTDLSLLAYLRNKYAHPPFFPLCGIAFQTISYPELLKKDFFYNALGDLYPFDSIISTSSAVDKAIKNLNALVTSSWQKERGLDIKYKGRLDSLPLGIEADDYARITKPEARRKLGLAEDKIILLYFGRLCLYDKADLYPLLIALKEISTKKKNVLLLVAGIDSQGNYGVKLKKIAKEMGLLASVKFVLHNCLKEKYALYAASDIFVSPSDSVQESFGITLLEAMASGLPVVASDWNGYKDLIAHNKTGFRIPTYWSDCKIGELYPETLFDLWPKEHLYLSQTVCVDVQKLTEYLSILLHSRRLRLEFGQNARNRIRQGYDWKALLPRYESLWLRLAALAKAHSITQKQKALFMPKYLRCFRHYATKILDGKTNLAITKGGLLFLKAKKLPFRIAEELEHIIAIKIIFGILISLKCEKEGAEISAVEGYIKSILKVRPHITRFNIMWMLKKDLLKLQIQG